MGNNIKPDKYYVIAFDNLVYVGKVLKWNDENWEVKFLSRGINKNFDWPRTETIEMVKASQFICGPLNIEGLPPFQIENIDKVRGDYLKYRKQERTN